MNSKNTPKKVKYSMLKIDKTLKLGKITSTQTLAKEIAHLFPKENILLKASAQTNGKGQYDRVWSSNNGGLYFTLILRPQKNADLKLLPYQVGKALAKTLEENYGLTTQIKLPNDVLAFHGNTFKKIAGILIETQTTEDNLNLLLIGVGVNVNNVLPKDLEATSLKQIKKSAQNIDALLENFLKEFAEEYLLWQNSI